LCRVSGDLTIRGISRPATVTLKVSKKWHSYRAVGETTVRLSTYGIAAPSQLGVRTSDDVRLRFEAVGDVMGLALSERLQAR
jgi:polyisoprenoid-binding protein YceI